MISILAMVLLVYNYKHEKSYQLQCPKSAYRVPIAVSIVEFVLILIANIFIAISFVNAWGDANEYMQVFMIFLGLFGVVACGIVSVLLTQLLSTITLGIFMIWSTYKKYKVATPLKVILCISAVLGLIVEFTGMINLIGLIIV